MGANAISRPQTQRDLLRMSVQVKGSPFDSVRRWQTPETGLNFPDAKEVTGSDPVRPTRFSKSCLALRASMGARLLRFAHKRWSQRWHSGRCADRPGGSGQLTAMLAAQNAALAGQAAELEEPLARLERASRVEIMFGSRWIPVPCCAHRPEGKARPVRRPRRSARVFGGLRRMSPPGCPRRPNPPCRDRGIGQAIVELGTGIAARLQEQARMSPGEVQGRAGT